MLLSAALGAAMATWTDAALPWLDATLTGFSLVAQLWMAQKRLQCWPLWVVVDIIYVGQYLHQQLYFTAGFFAVLTLIAVRGWLNGAVTRRWCSHERGTIHESSGAVRPGIQRQELAQRGDPGAFRRRGGG